MRLLNVLNYAIEEFHGHASIPPYAILSHRWEEEEVSFQDMQTGNAYEKRGWKKIENCCQLAKSELRNYVWIDTCCIDKTSSCELSEAINSMFE